MYGTVLVGTDGSPGAERAVAQAAEVAQRTASKLVVMAVGDQAEAQATAEASLQAHQPPGVVAEARAASGDPAKALVAVAQELGAGLIVVGSKGMTGARHVLGSVPNSVSHHAPCHLLIVQTA